MPVFALSLILTCIVIEAIEQSLYRAGSRHRSKYLACVLPAIALNLVSMAVWLLVLKRMELGKALPLLAANNIAVALAGRLLFGERVTLRRWTGIALIVAGFALVAMNQT